MIKKQKHFNSENIGYKTFRVRYLLVYMNSALFHTCCLLMTVLSMCFLHARITLEFPDTPLARICPLCNAVEVYLEPASGTPQSTRRSRSSRTLPRGSGGGTSPRPPAREGRREESGSRSNIDLRPGRPAISPEIQQPLHTDTHRCTRCTMHEQTHIHSPSPCTCPRTCPRTCFEWPSWREAPEWHCLASGNTLWKWRCRLKHTEPKCYSPIGRKKPTIYSSFMVTAHSFHQLGLYSLTPWWRDPAETLPQSTEALTCQHTPPTAALTSLQCVDDL